MELICATKPVSTTNYDIDVEGKEYWTRDIHGLVVKCRLFMTGEFSCVCLRVDEGENQRQTHMWSNFELWEKDLLVFL